MRTRIVFPLVVATTLTYASLGYGQEGPVLPAAAAPIDGTLFTTYSIDRAHTRVSWLVCGNLPRSGGCYASGNIGSFGKVGALLEGNPETDRIAHTVTRAIYVVDVASGPSQNEVVLDVYTKVDTLTTDFDTVTVTLDRAISLPLVGGASTQTSMAANKQFLFIGTDQSPFAVEMNKRSFSVMQRGSFSPPNVSAITADQYGYVTLTFGSFRSFHATFIVCDPDGNIAGDGGGSPFMLNSVQALQTSTLP